MSELRQARFFAASCVAFYVIMVWAFWKEPWAPPPPPPEAPADVQPAGANARAFRQGADALAQLTPLVSWFVRPPAWVGGQLAGAVRAWLGLSAIAVPDRIKAAGAEAVLNSAHLASRVGPPEPPPDPG